MNNNKFITKKIDDYLILTTNVLSCLKQYKNLFLIFNYKLNYK